MSRMRRTLRHSAFPPSEKWCEQVHRLWGYARPVAPIASPVRRVNRSPFVSFFLPSRSNARE
jgi:hypothetical protein